MADEVPPVSQSNGEDSEPNQETVREAIDSESGQTFSYDQLKAKSDNPVTGIDFKRREVSIMNICISSFNAGLLLMLVYFPEFLGLSV